MHIEGGDNTKKAKTLVSAVVSRSSHIRKMKRNGTTTFIQTICKQSTKSILLLKQQEH